MVHVHTQTIIQKILMYILPVTTLMYFATKLMRTLQVLNFFSRTHKIIIGHLTFSEYFWYSLMHVQFI